MTSPPRGLVRLTLRNSLGGQVQRNVLHVAPALGWDDFPSAARRLSQAVDIWFQDAVPGFSSPASLMGAEGGLVSHVIDLLPAPPALRRQEKLIFEIARRTFGLSPALPGNASFCLHLDCDGPFRRHDGRVFLPFLPEDALSSDRPGFVTEDFAGRAVRAWGGFERVVNLWMGPEFAVEHLVWLRSHQVGGPDAMPVTSRVRSWSYRSLRVASQVQRQRRVGRS